MSFFSLKVLGNLKYHPPFSFRQRGVSLPDSFSFRQRGVSPVFLFFSHSIFFVRPCGEANWSAQACHFLHAAALLGSGEVRHLSLSPIGLETAENEPGPHGWGSGALMWDRSWLWCSTQSVRLRGRRKPESQRHLAVHVGRYCIHLSNCMSFQRIRAVDKNIIYMLSILSRYM